MLESILADTLLVLHFFFIIFVVLGGLLTLCWRWMPIFHLPAVLWGAYIEFYGVVCPLTPLEQQLREKAGQTAYSGGFIDHYLIPIIYPSGLAPWHQIVLGIFVIVINVVIYACILLYWRNRHSATD